MATQRLQVKNGEDFRRVLRSASDQVGTWPDWKRGNESFRIGKDFLGIFRGMSPTNGGPKG